MKLVDSYYLLDKNGKKVLEFGEDVSNEHLKTMKCAYEIIYKDRAPMAVFAKDVLENLSEIDL